MKQKKASIQYPDGQYHTIDIFKFYKVKVAGRDEYVIEYDDLSYNSRNCFAVLELENNVFVKKTLGSEKAYKYFYSMMLFAFKKNVDFELIPDSIHLCKSAQEELYRANPIVQPDVRFAYDTKKELIVCVDIGTGHDSFPYYLEGNTAKALGFVKEPNGYYHLTPQQFERLKKEYEIVYKYIDLGSKLTVIVYEDVSYFRSSFPYYIDAPVARSLGLSNIASGYYHLKPAELELIKSKYNVEYRKITLTFGYKSKKKIRVYEDIGENREFFPYYLDAATAKELGFVTDFKGYYHLTSELLEGLKKEFEIDYISLVLNLGIGKAVNGGVPGKNVSNNENPTSNDRTILVIEDISTIHEEHPYYLERSTAVSVGKYTDKAFYHLSPSELSSLKAKYQVRVEGRKISILDQNSVKNKISLEEKNSLTKEELAKLDNLFDRLVDFKDYYQFFGLEHMRNLPALEVINSKEFIDLTTLITKGAACGNVIAINLLDFLEEFKKTLKNKLTLK